MSDLKLTFRRSIESQLLVEHALALKIGDVFTYEKMGDLTGREFPHDRHYWIAARRRLMLEYQIHFDVVPGIGYARITHDQLVCSTKPREHSYRCARRRMTALSSVEFDGLKSDSKIQHNIDMSIQQIIKITASGKSTKRLEAAIGPASENKKLDIADTLKALGYKG